MRTIANFLQAVNDQDLPFLAVNSMADTAPEYIKEQKDQLYSGFDSKGQRLLSYRSSIYAKKKNEMNSIPGLGNPDLKLTGAFYNSMRADIDNDGLMVYATDDKTSMLDKKYGNDIYTLGNDWKVAYIEILAPVFVANVVDSLRQ